MKAALFRLAPVLLTAAAAVTASACAGSPGPEAAVAVLSSDTTAALTAQVKAMPSSGSASAQALVAQARTPLVVPAGEGGGALSTPRQLTVPAGWTARVWARVTGPRMEAWTPEKQLLVSDPGDGKILELKPESKGTATAVTVLSRLTEPQGMAFAKLKGQWVLYVAESDQIDKYPWASGHISGARTVIAKGLADLLPGDSDVHRVKDLAVAANGTVYFDVGSASNATPADRTMSPQRAVIMSVSSNGQHLRVVERGVRNGEGMAVAPNGSVWTAVNERDDIPYPFHGPYAQYRDAFGMVIQAYVNNHPPDEVAPVAQGRDLGWPYCDPDQDLSQPAGSLASIPLIANSVTNPGGKRLNCARLAPINVGIPAHSAPLGLKFLEGTTMKAPWSGGAVVAAHGSWDREPARGPALLWMAWNAGKHTLMPAITLVGGFQNPDGSFWGRPVDAVPGPDGALYVSDDSAEAIYRLAPPRKLPLDLRAGLARGHGAGEDPERGPQGALGDHGEDGGVFLLGR